MPNREINYIAVFQKLVKMKKTLNIWRGEWSQQLDVLNVSCIMDIIGVWCCDNRVYPLMHEGERGIGLEGIGKENDE